MPFMTMLVLYAPACDAIGHPEVGVRNGREGAAILTVAFLLWVRWGITGLALAWLAAYPFYLVLGSRRALPVIGVRAGELVRAVAPPLVAALAMAALVGAVDAALPPLHPVPRLVLWSWPAQRAMRARSSVVARPLVGELTALVRR
ncbi:polysaccharide biosynthesis C-terminal domain-containing protein [Sphingomonas sp. MMS24-JH45]